MLVENGYSVMDDGTHSSESVDYPDFGVVVAQAVSRGEADCGVLICGTGIGMSMVANRVKGVRAARCLDLYSARMARQDNDANVLCLGGRLLAPALAWEILKVFLETPFEGGRHLRRIQKIHRLDPPESP